MIENVKMMINKVEKQILEFLMKIKKKLKKEKNKI